MSASLQVLESSALWYHLSILVFLSSSGGVFIGLLVYDALGLLLRQLIRLLGYFSTSKAHAHD